MSIPADLSYRFRPANPVQRALQALVASRPGAWVFSRTLPHLDSVVQRLSGGRHTVPGLLAGLPVVQLTTTGRRSGQRRTTHLIAIPYDDTLALLGTNFGQPDTPAWALNLEAQPHATLAYRDAEVPVVARLADAQEMEQVLRRSEELYVGYRRYQSRITHRRLRVFVLEPAAS
ncbi:nitroreductase family deazaflavin-dependent oxidoreductase [Nocardioides dokdonensis]|nr:nitroreductase family deazaflavin-dependent oxidoreductase [Nocardioides dokdonensis]